MTAVPPAWDLETQIWLQNFHLAQGYFIGLFFFFSSYTPRNEGEWWWGLGKWLEGTVTCHGKARWSPFSPWEKPGASVPLLQPSVYRKPALEPDGSPLTSTCSRGLSERGKEGRKT